MKFYILIEISIENENKLNQLVFEHPHRNMSLDKINLPTEIITKIFENLDPLDLKNTRATCKSFRQIADYVLTLSAQVRFSVKLYRQVKESVIVYGGCTNEELWSLLDINQFSNWPTNCEIIGKSTNNNLKLPPLPQKLVVNEDNPILVYDYNQNKLLFIGSRITYVLIDEKWYFHSQFENRRKNGFAVAMPHGIYLFNKLLEHNTNNVVNLFQSQTYRNCRPKHKTLYRFLPANGQTWTICSASFPRPQVMDRYSCGLAISSNEFVLLRDFNDCGIKTSLIKCNTENGIWTEMGNLQEDRSEYAAILFNGKIIVCGGDSFTRSTEIIPLNILQKSPQFGMGTSEIISRKVGDINFPRRSPALGILKIDGKSKVILFGGGELVEEWDDEKEIWEISTNFIFKERFDFFAHC